MYTKESDFEEEVFNRSKDFFGKNAVLINAKKKIGSEHLGNVIPDGFLFDFSDPQNPEFYLLEIELQRHGFYEHIFPQITKFFAFYKNSEKQKELVEKLFSIINTESDLKRQFKKYLGEKEIFKFLSDTINNSQNILIVIDGLKVEFTEIIDTYADTWGKIVKIIEIKKFCTSNESIFSISPEFDAIQYSTPTKAEDAAISITEEFHLEDVDGNLRNIYQVLKKGVLAIMPEAIFNPQKYYISIKAPKNISFIKFRSRRLGVIVMIPEHELILRIKHHKIKKLSQSVQNFYNGPCASIEIYSDDNISEVIEAISFAAMNKNNG